jgi:zinc protease
LVVVLYLLLTSCAATAQKEGPPPEPQPLARVDFPAYEKRVLPNGLTVYALEQHEQPTVAIHLLIAAGSDRDPKDLPGVAVFTADLLNKGTKTRNATQLAEAIDQVGASLESSADKESTAISAAVLKDNVGLGFELINDILMNPAFSQQELERSQQQAMSSLAANMEDSDFVADAVFERVIYGSHAYGQPQDGTLKSIPRITRNNLQNFYNTYYAPNISALAIVGDISAADAFKLTEQWFGSWKMKDVVRREDTEIPKMQGRRIVVVDKPDSVQTEIRVGHPTIRRKDPDYFSLLFASYVLGGSGSGRLNQSLRVERGLTYGAYSTIRPRRGPSSFFAATDTRTEKSAEALNLIFTELQKIRATEVPSQELKDAKSFIIGSFPLSIEVPNDLATRLTTIFLYELGDDYLKTYRDRLAAVSAADVLRVAKEKISADSTAVVLVGKAADFQKELMALGKIELIPVSRLDLDSPTLQ